jgi:peptidyl-prolyl cis-trans isomerase D
MALRTKQMKAADIELGTLAKNELPAELAAPVFALTAPGPVEPVKSAFGWHLARVESITPGTQKSLADVKAELAQIVSQRKAGEALPKLRNRIDDLIAGGANVAEIAKQQNGEVKTSPLLDAQGRDAGGQPVSGLPPVPTLLNDAFQHLQAGSEPLLIDDNEGGFHAIAVAEVKPENLQPLADVKAKVTEAVTQRARAKAAEERASQIATRLSGGGEFLKEAQALGVLAASTPPLLRSGQPAERNFTPALVTKLFAATPASPVISGPASTAGDQIVARLVKITPADAAAIANEYERTQQQVTQAMVSDLAEQYRKTLEAAIGVRVDNAARARARAL